MKALHSWKILIALALIVGLLAVLSWELTSLSKWVGRALVLAALVLNALAAHARKRVAKPLQAP